MIKQVTILEEKIGDRVYQLSCGSDSPLGELHDALMLMKGYCVERMVAAQKEEQENADRMKEESCHSECE
jgi:hypothetical protein